MLELTRLNLVLEPDAPWRPGPDLGNTVRGAFGNALHSIACVVPGRRCQGCREEDQCLYPVWYEGPGHAVRPFALRVVWTVGEVVSSERPIRVTIVFFGHVPRTGWIVEAVMRMARVGLGSHRVPHRVVHALVEGKGAGASLVGGGPASIWPEPAPLSRFSQAPTEHEDVRVTLVTPVDFGKRVGGGRPSPAQLLLLARDRVLAIARLQGVRIPRPWPRVEQAGGHWEDLHYERGHRRSAAQERSMPMSGWVGTVGYPAVSIAPFLDLLAAAEVVQVGGWTTAGLGVVAVERVG